MGDSFLKRILFLIFSIVGFGLLFWSAMDWFDLMSGARMDSSFCTLSSYWNCDRAGLSPAGSWAGIPTGVFGALWFLAVIVLGLSGSFLLVLRRVLLVLGVLVAAAMGSYLFFVLKAGCIICLASYVCILGALWAGWSLQWRVISSRAAVFSFLIGLCVLAAHASYRMVSLDGKIPVEEIPAYWQSLPVKTITAQSPLSYGPEDAKITVLEFSDFACPYCALAAGTMMNFLKSQKDVRVLFFPFPFDSQCNRAMNRSAHPGVCDWSKLALCAQAQGKFWPVHDWIFAQTRSQQSLPKLESAWGQLGLDVEQAKACLADPATDAQLKDLVESALQLDVKSTPTFFFNGRMISGFLPIPVLKHLLTEARK